MNLRNCSECGVLMVDNPSGRCPACNEEELIAEDKVAEYLRGVTKASIDEIHEATGVKIKTILRMISRGRVSSDVAISYPCESCGAPITEGKLCLRCNENILSQIRKLDLQPEKKEEKPKSREDRMHIADILGKNDLRNK